MTLILVSLVHGEDIDLVYFWSSVLMILLPITIFSTLTYFVVKAYLRRKAPPPARNQ